MNRLKELREELGLSLSTLSKELDIPKTSLSNYERGEREPRLDVWVRIADYFGVDPAYLMGLSDIKNFSRNEVAHLSFGKELSEHDWDKLMLLDNLQKISNQEDLDTFILENKQFVNWLQGIIFAYETLKKTTNGLEKFEPMVKLLFDFLMSSGYMSGDDVTKEDELKFYKTKEQFDKACYDFFESSKHVVYRSDFNQDN